MSIGGGLVLCLSGCTKDVVIASFTKLVCFDAFEKLEKDLDPRDKLFRHNYKDLDLLVKYYWPLANTT